MDSELVNIVVITFNRLDRTRRCIASLVEHTSHPHVLTVVDNASTDGTREYLLDLKARGVITNLALLRKNMGVSVAFNLGWSLCDAPYFIRLDNDMIILRPGWLTPLVKTAAACEKVAQISYFYQDEKARREDIREVILPSGHRVFLAGGCSGGCVMVPRAMHKRYGFWCEDYGLYGEEDADYSIRVRAGGDFCCYLPDQGVIFTDGFQAGEEQYRDWKRQRHYDNLKLLSNFKVNEFLYERGLRPLYMPRRYQFVPSDGFEFLLNGVDKDYAPIDQMLEKYRIVIGQEIVRTLKE